MPTTQHVLRRVLGLLRSRGWTYRYSIDRDGPLNLRSAISASCTALCSRPGGEWHDAYIACIDALTSQLGEALSHWEYGPQGAKTSKRRQSEVEQLLEDTIKRLDTNEKANDRRRPSAGSDPRAV